MEAESEAFVVDAEQVEQVLSRQREHEQPFGRIAQDLYGISETTFGIIIGIGFLLSFFAQIVIGPLGDQGYARVLVLGGAFVNA